jgi:hypothetical protein
VGILNKAMVPKTICVTIDEILTTGRAFGICPCCPDYFRLYSFHDSWEISQR